MDHAVAVSVVCVVDVSVVRVVDVSVVRDVDVSGGSCCCRFGGLYY